jgi:hypothetical protein
MTEKRLGVARPGSVESENVLQFLRHRDSPARAEVGVLPGLVL